VPVLGEAAPRAVLRHPEIAQRRVVEHQMHLGLKALATFFPSGLAAHIAKIHFIDDRQHGNFEQNGMQPRALDLNVQLAGRLGRFDGNAFFRQAEQPEEIHEVALDEPQAAQIVQLFFGEAQLAKRMDLGADLVQVGAQIDVGRTAFIAILHLRRGKVMQHDLHHAELVQIRIE
jgi:hypothetical protein